MRITRDASDDASRLEHADRKSDASSSASASLTGGQHAVPDGPFVSTEGDSGGCEPCLPAGPIISRPRDVAYCRLVGSMSSTIQGHECRGVFLVSAFFMTVIFMISPGDE